MIEAIVRMTRFEAYRVLTVTRSCSEREIRRKYRLLARKYHPDKWNEKCEFTKEVSEKIFKNLSSAYTLIGMEE